MASPPYIVLFLRLQKVSFFTPLYIKRILRGVCDRKNGVFKKYFCFTKKKTPTVVTAGCVLTTF